MMKVFLRKITITILLTAAFFCVTDRPVMAGRGKIEFTEVDVQLFEDGNAVIEYVVRWRILETPFIGFYFSGLDRLAPIFDKENA